MTGIAIAFLLLALVLVWGGLIASILFLRARTELETYPPGGEDDDHREDEAPGIRDT
ncbi:hypothetical protein ABIE21_002011 [Conyzicola nivalis]|uniref:Methionine/alanine importer small subunit n=1 Tax=Conyzicola nivalis TaxID=1477021 RepID=A0ABV2QN75_9MICO